MEIELQGVPKNGGHKKNFSPNHRLIWNTLIFSMRFEMSYNIPAKIKEARESEREYQNYILFKQHHIKRE